MLQYSKEKFFPLIVEVFAINSCQYWTKLLELKKGLCYAIMKKQKAVFFHVSSLKSQSNFAIRTANTNCFIIGLGYRKKLDPSLKIWLEVEVQIRNNL